MKKRITLAGMFFMIITAVLSQTTSVGTVVSDNIRIKFEITRILDCKAELNGSSRGAAEKIMKNTTGLFNYSNKIEARWYDGLRPNDLEINTRVNNALKKNEHTNEWQIIVNVSGGIVTLWGVVDSLFEKRKAESTVQAVNGVRKVINKIIVNYPYPYFDNRWDDYPYYNLFIDPPVIIEVNALHNNEINNITEREMLWLPYSDAFKVIDADRVSLTVFRFGYPR